MGNIALKKWLFGSIVVSLAITALLGVVAILSTLDDFGLRVTFTTLIISGASIVALPPAIQLERGKHWLLAWAALIATALGALLLLRTIWFDAFGDTHFKWVVTLCIASCALSTGCLLLLGSLAPKFQPVQMLAIVLACAFAGILIWTIWSNHEVSWRVIAVIALLFATSGLAVPVLHRLSALEASGAGASGDGGAEPCAGLRCPNCGCAHPRVKGSMDCSCGCKFSIEELGSEDRSS